jgi:hypothetical protein
VNASARSPSSSTRSHEITAAGPEPHLPRLELGDVEDLIHQPQEAARIAERQIDLFDGVGGKRRLLLVDQILQRPDGQGERRAELVRDVGEEAGLRRVEFLQLARLHLNQLDGLREGARALGDERT